MQKEMVHQDLAHDFIPKMIADIAPGNISIKNGFMGPNYTTVSACASSANSMIDALNTIRLGHCDVVVTGGSEAAVTIAGMGGFNALHAMSPQEMIDQKLRLDLSMLKVMDLY